MKTNNFKLISILAFMFLTTNANAQTGPSLFKDLTSGITNSNPEQFTNVNGTMYFIAIVGSSRLHQLWKSDGTEANTMIVKDSIISTNIGGAVTIRGNINSTLFYSVNKLGTTAGDTTRLWKTDGTTPVLVAILSHPGYPSVGGGYPTDFTVVGNKLFFSMWKDHGRELWVSDGTTAGTFEVIDLNPGNNGAGFQYGGVEVNQPMIAFNGKVYFRGNTTIGINELYSSDGTAGGTAVVKAGIYDPTALIVYKNEIYFGASNPDGFWKTNGIAVGTVKITNTAFNKDAKIFKNEMFYSSGGKLWKSDGTTAGTVMMKDSAGGVIGMNSNYFFTSYFKSLPSPPYYTTYYWRSDGTTAGTVRVSDSLGKGASFAVINNKMYNAATSGVGYTSNLWETDGTEAGTKKLLTGYPGYPFILNTNVFFSNHTSATGYELWYYKPSPTSVNEHNSNQLPSAFSLEQNYPNPFNPNTTIRFEIQGLGLTTLKVYDIVGREVTTLVNENLNAGKYEVKFDGSTLSSGIYFYQLRSGQFIETKRMLMIK